ncbi:LytTR family transcriptional regulator [Enterococcus thailandicus]|uniref:HTH luxR-type domain-containing protein n=1 Tax=bioreactor metagenome TaxID=1076179 RepID=A0A645CYL1_9ZZZZ|nr:DUF2087 domain-containing protein [Enterococcus thailandicus]ASZ07044.1 LytTR family transcriptional regulator [Enterococcus thailandicus]MDK4352355.1 DUF2087 domain-containing protein [Enterococcus thailandicus]MDT2734721.1 DUF2087 domain-containing protein [Enterococcus thailandicus]MEA4829794.1 DUF2087 domain-containing protein [Enterococcus thailandicus]GMC04576.1 LytTR family transcriptional regulator [Enterococcus thailandicus]
METELLYEQQDYLNGWTIEHETYQCLYCDVTFQFEKIYPDLTTPSALQTAKGAITQHLRLAHGGPLHALLQLSRESLGLSESQYEIIQLFEKNLSDTVIAQRLGISPSTVRNHRFKLKEKERQAKRLTALMKLLPASGQTFISPHTGARMLDERYNITPAEQEKILQTYLDDNDFIQIFPSKEKRKIILLNYLTQKFDPKKNYSEHAINDILKQHVADFVSTRRYLIEYGFMQRTTDGKTYWLNQ